MKIKFCRKPITIVILVGIVIIGVIAIMWFIHTHNQPKPKVYFSSSFDDGISMYKTLDATWKPLSDNSKKGIVTLSTKEYAAPYLMIPLTLEQNPPNSFVFHIKTYIASYTNEAINVGTLVYPTGSISIVTNQDEQVGVSNNLFAKPFYSNTAALKRDRWNDIYAYVDTKNSEISIYINSKLVLSREFEDTIYPVQEIWLGSIWLYGGGRYGAPKNVQFSYVQLGNEGILPKPTIIEYIQNNLFELSS